MTKKFSLEHFSEADFIPPDLSKIPEVRGKIRTSINFNHDEGSIGIVLADDEIVDGDDLRTWMHTLSGDASDVPMEGFPNLKVAEDQFYRPLLNVSFYHLSDRALMEYVFVPRQAEIEEKIKKIWRKHIKEVGRQLGYDMVGRFYSEKEDAVADLEDPDYFMLEELRSSFKNDLAYLHYEGASNDSPYQTVCLTDPKRIAEMVREIDFSRGLMQRVLDNKSAPIIKHVKKDSLN